LQISIFQYKQVKALNLFHHLVKALSFRNVHASSVVLLFFFFDK
jgi:hypothetical protein